MNELEEIPHPAEQQVLKQRLLFGELEPKAFLDELYALDQATDTRDAATDNLAVLDDANVRSFFTEPQLHDQYFKLLSMTNFHIGQQKAAINNPDAAKNTENALNAAKQVTTSAGYAAWIMYVEGTLAYLKKDIESLRKIVDKNVKGPNGAILANLLGGLEERGDISYLADYHTRLRTI